MCDTYQKSIHWLIRLLSKKPYIKIEKKTNLELEKRDKLFKKWFFKYRVHKKQYRGNQFITKKNKSNKAKCIINPE